GAPLRRPFRGRAQPRSARAAASPPRRLSMGFTLEHSFLVKAPAERVWSFLTDPNRVAAALPGAAITEKVSDDSYKGTITVKVGTVSAKYRGQVRFESLDAAAGSARIVAS